MPKVIAYTAMTDEERVDLLMDTVLSYGKHHPLTRQNKQRLLDEFHALRKLVERQPELVEGLVGESITVQEQEEISLPAGSWRIPSMLGVPNEPIF
ncbi:MAG: hypothetical protein UX94_C0001G0034 [Parcubacteria group bacterium GW2011_GWA2_47_21]|nr:MAG: hypothetical protein UX94_C0001G0034 [Parcubacteria group bacterium GW2011_GWA2_47_21]